MKLNNYCRNIDIEFNIYLFIFQFKLTILCLKNVVLNNKQVVYDNLEKL